MDLKKLRYFAVIAELRSINKAAVQLRISQPALSRQLRLLEGDLGQALVVRHGRGVMLTDAGMRLLDQARVVFDALENLENVVRADHADEPERLVLGLNGAPSRYLCPLLLEQFCKARPNLQVEFSVSSSEALQRQVLAGRADLAVLSNPIPEEELVTIPLVIEEVHMVRTALDNGADATIQDFADLQFTTTAYLKEEADKAIHELFSAAGLVPPVPVVINSIPMTREVLLDGSGFYVGPPANYGPEIRSGDLVSMPLPGIFVTRCIAVKRDRILSNTMVALERFLHERAADLTADGVWPHARASDPIPV